MFEYPTFKKKKSVVIRRNILCKKKKKNDAYTSCPCWIMIYEYINYTQ